MATSTVCNLTGATASFIRLTPRLLDGCRADPDRLHRILAGQVRSTRRADIGDAWDGLHYLLSPRRRAGAELDRGDPFGLGLLGGDVLNPHVLDPHQWVRRLEPAAVIRIDRELQKVHATHLSRQYEPARMDALKVAPGGWQLRGDEGFEYLLDAFLQWRELFHLAAEENQAVLCLLH